MRGITGPDSAGLGRRPIVTTRTTCVRGVLRHGRHAFRPQWSSDRGPGPLPLVDDVCLRRRRSHRAGDDRMVTRERNCVERFDLVSTRTTASWARVRYIKGRRAVDTQHDVSARRRVELGFRCGAPVHFARDGLEVGGAAGARSQLEPSPRLDPVLSKNTNDEWAVE